MSAPPVTPRRAGRGRAAADRAARPLLAAGALAAMLAAPIGAAADGPARPATEAAASAGEPPALEARVVATGIPGAGAVSEVGRFHPGGPIADKPDFRAYTGAGRILDPGRVLVASTSNFGAARNDAGEYEGGVLSIDPRGAEAVPVPPDLGRGGGQSSALGGAVQLFTAQAAGFANRVDNPGAVSADAASVSYPLGISINDGFGRLWFANAPKGSGAPGTISILDPGGRPLVGAPDRRAGGVFVGDATGRAPQQRIPGRLWGTLATASMGMSPDGSHRAVFAALNGDGSLAQVHTEQGVDGLAPPGSVTPFPLPKPEDVDDGAPVTRAGMAFNWVPNRVLFVSDPARDAVVALHLGDDGALFRVEGVTTMASPSFHAPVDLAPAVPEIANPGFASGSTSSSDGDLYVANRGDGTLVRIHQDGTVVASRRIAVGGVPIGPNRLNGVATSADARHLWITVTGPSPGGAGTGALLEVPAFDRRSAEAGRGDPPRLAAADAEAAAGAAAFQHRFTPGEGLGPLFNGTSCADCHSSPTLGGGGARDLGIVRRVGAMADGVFALPAGRAVPVARAHSVGEFGLPCGLDAGVPGWANVVSARAAMPLYGVGLIDAIPDGDILSDDPSGHANVGPARPGVGRFGWKADVVDLETFVAEAFRNEMGIRSGARPSDDADRAACPTGSAGPDRPDELIRAVTAFLRALPAPAEAPSPTGLAAFAAAGCDGCHRPALRTRDGRPVPLFSDLRVHDMGPSLDDGIPQGAAAGAEWRTAPLWGLRDRTRFLHDGRASTVAAAILAHDGEGQAAADRFRRLPPEARDELLRFLGSI